MSHSKTNSVLFENPEFSSKFLENMKELMVQGKFCDAVIKVKENSFPVHRVVLASAIPYFNELFKRESRENKKLEVIMDEMESRDVRGIINYSYTGKIEIDSECVSSLVVSATKLNLLEIRGACIDFHSSNFGIYDVLNVAKFAETIACHELEIAADQYVNKNFSEIALTEGFMSLEFDDFMAIVSSSDIAVTSEEEVFEAAMRWVKRMESSRVSYLPRIMKEIRFSLISPDYLIDFVESEKIIKTSLECRDILDEAKNFHLGRKKLVQTQRKCRFVPKIYVISKSKLISKGTMQIFNLLNCQWISSEPFTLEKEFFRVVSVNQDIYVIGGKNGARKCLASVDVYNIRNKTWMTCAPMIYERSSFGVAVLGDCIYVCGGFDRDTISNVESYSLTNGVWTEKSPMKAKRNSTHVAALNGKIYAIGGCDSLFTLKSCESYDPLSDEWTPIKSIQESRVFFCGRIT